jgi:hypothetical protein
MALNTPVAPGTQILRTRNHGRGFCRLRVQTDSRHVKLVTGVSVVGEVGGLRGVGVWQREEGEHSSGCMVNGEVGGNSGGEIRWNRRQAVNGPSRDDVMPLLTSVGMWFGRPTLGGSRYRGQS